MCFSAEASFVAGTVLLATGVATVRKASTPVQLPMATIPIMFSVQQYIECILWLAHNNPVFEHWRSFATYMFVIFAYVVWTSWVPLCFWILEKDDMRRKILGNLSVLGFFLSLYLAGCIVFFPVMSAVNDCHIQYFVGVSGTVYLVGSALYLLVIILPPFISKLRYAPFLASLNLMAYLISKFYFSDYLFSVWCFFAALISVSVYMIVSALNERKVKEDLSTLH